MSDPTLKGNSGLKKNSASVKGETSSRRPPPSHRHRHLNLRAVIILAFLVVVGSVGFFLAKNYQDHRQGAALLAEAKKFLEQEPKQPNLALTYLNRYLEQNPKDIDALDLKSKLLFELMRSPEQALAAIPTHEQVVRNDTQHTRQDTLRRLVQLTLLVGKWQTAHTYALDLLKTKEPTAFDYRLLGDTLAAWAAQGKATVSDAATGNSVNIWDEAIKNYEEAQRLEPGNIYVAKRLATLYQNQRADSKKAMQVLDNLLEQVKTDDEKALAHSARYDYFAENNQPDLARAELDQAVRLKPKDADILLKAAYNAMLRGDTETGRKYIDAIPGQMRSDLRLAILGEMDVREKKLDSAIRDWREGLKVTGGTSDVLTWRLAYMLLRLGRLNEAEPLLAQYHRLTDRPDGTAIPKAVYLDALESLKKNQPAEAIRRLEPIRLKSDDNTSAGAARQALDDSKSLGAEVAFTLGQCYEQLGKDQQALEAYGDAGKIVREARGLKWADPWIGAANVLQRANRLEEAAGEIEDGLIAIPNDPGLLINLGRIRLAQQARLPKDRRAFGDVDKILEEARKANPTSLDLIKLQVPYLATSGRLDEAAALLASATDPKNKPQSPELWAIQAEVLRRLSEPAKALEALDRGTKAVGEHALFRIARAEVLNSQGRDKDAYATLEEGVGLVPPEQRLMILKALGDMHRRANDLLAARKTYSEWAKLDPQDPQPQLLVLELALAADDEPAIRASTATIKKIGGLADQLASALTLLKDPTSEDQNARDKRLTEAGNIVDAIIKDYPGRPTGYLLRAQVLEKQGHPDEAIQAYRQAREHNGGPEALRALFILLARQRRFNDLARLRTELYAGELTPDLEWLAAGIALALGEKDEAEHLVQEVVKGDPQGLSTKLRQVGVLNALGKPKEAEEILQTLIQQRPDELEPRIAMLMFQINQKQFQKAAEVVEQIRVHVKSDQPEFLWAGCYAVLGDMVKANQYYKASLQKWPTDQEVLLRAVAFFRATGRNEETEATLRELLKREPKHAWGRRELAQFLSARRNDLPAWNEAIKLIGDKPNDSDTSEDRLVRATVLVREPSGAHTKEGIRILEELVAGEAPGAVSTMAHELLARLYTDANQLAEARPHAQAAVARSNDPNLIAFYAELLLRDKQPAEADKQVDRLAQFEPESLRVLDLRSRILNAQERSADAAALLETTFSNVEKLPNGETVGRKIVEMLTGLKQLDAAERVGRRLAELWPKSAWALSQALARNGKLDEALKFCQTAVAAGAPLEGGGTAGILVANNRPLGADGEARLKQAEAILAAAIKQLPDNFHLSFLRASVQRTQGRYADATQIYRSLLAQNSDNPLVLNNLAWTLSEDLDQPAEGLEHIDAAIKKIGRDPSLLDTRGVILTRLGKLDQAISDLEAAAQSSPSAEKYYHLARAYHKASRMPEFQKNRTRAKETGLSPNLLQPNERAEMDKLMRE